MVTLDDRSNERLRAQAPASPGHAAAARQLAELLATVGEAIITIDSEQRIVNFNREAERLFGYRAPDVLGKFLDMLLPAGSVHAHRARMRSFAESDETRRLMGGRPEIRGRRRDGGEFVAEAAISKLEIDGELLFTAVLRDVTQLREAERNLQISEQRFRDIAGLAGDWLWETDAGYRVSFVGGRLKESAGFGERHSIGKTLWEIAQVDPDRDERWRDIRADLEARRPFGDRPCAVVGSDGRRHDLFVSGTPIFDPAGRFNGYRGAIRDVTGELAARRELERSRAQASKVEALGNLAGGIAHDFNNLLGAISGFAQFLVQDLDPNSDQHGYAERILAVAERGHSLVQQILSFTRQAPVELVPVPLREAIAETYALLRATLPATTELLLDDRADDAVVLADKGLLAQVLVNLCVNGSDALGDRPGGVTISVARFDDPRPEFAQPPLAQGGDVPSIMKTWREPSGTVCMVTGIVPAEPCVSLTVSDTGAGISESLLEQIFEPFFTTKEVGRGTGLGLAVVRRIVLELGGALRVRTRDGVGSSFEVVLKRVAAPPRPATAADTRRRHAPFGALSPQLSILVVDDDEAHREMVQTALRRRGHAVRSTADPRVALDWVEERLDKFDVLITDQTMPYVKGGDLVRRLKTVAPETICIICTGNNNGLNERDTAAAGADAFLLKPFDVAELEALVAKLATPDGRVMPRTSPSAIR